jgi:hypothetical protein
MKMFTLIAWGVILPFALWFGLIALSHHGLRSPSGAAAWVWLGVVTIAGGSACFRLPTSALWRIVAFVAYLPVIAFSLGFAGIFFDCGVYHNCP